MKRYGTTTYEVMTPNRVQISYISNGNYLTSKGHHIRHERKRWNLYDAREERLASYPSLKAAVDDYASRYKLREITK